MSTEAKLIRVGLDPNNLHTLPGSSGEITLESTDNDNTIFGGIFSSTLPGVLSYSFSGNAWLRETPGYEVTLKRQGISTSFTTESMSQFSGQTYMINDWDKNLWDWDEPLTVFNNGSPVASSNIESIDYMFGRIVFVPGFTPGTVTVSGNYFPLLSFGCVNSISLTQTVDIVDNSCQADVLAAGGFLFNRAGLKTVSAELSGFYRQANNFFNVLKEREILVLEVNWDGINESVCRGVFRVSSVNQSGDVGQNEESSASLSLFVPEDVLPFSWYFGSETLMSAGMIDIIRSWETRQDLYFEYWPEGTSGEKYSGQLVVGDASLSVDVDGIPEMSISATGNGALDQADPIGS